MHYTGVLKNEISRKCISANIAKGKRCLFLDKEDKKCNYMRQLFFTSIKVTSISASIYSQFSFCTSHAASHSNFIFQQSRSSPFLSHKHFKIHFFNHSFSFSLHFFFLATSFSYTRITTCVHRCQSKRQINTESKFIFESLVERKTNGLSAIEESCTYTYILRGQLNEKLLRVDVPTKCRQV